MGFSEHAMPLKHFTGCTEMASDSTELIRVIDAIMGSGNSADKAMRGIRISAGVVSVHNPNGSIATVSTRHAFQEQHARSAAAARTYNHEAPPWGSFTDAPTGYNRHARGESSFDRTVEIQAPAVQREPLDIFFGVMMCVLGAGTTLSIWGNTILHFWSP